MTRQPANHPLQLYVAASAAFCTYFCMYAFRKPFTAATFEEMEFYGTGLKSALVLSQLFGYMLSKFIGIKVVAELRGDNRGKAIVCLIGLAELALVGFAYVSVPLKVAMLFVNGLALGMVFGLVLSYLEGRRHTEALSAMLCASFIISSGVVKTVGSWLLVEWQVSEFQMPMFTGLMFFPPLLISVWLLQRTPPPDDSDIDHRHERVAMHGVARVRFLSAYLPGLSLLVLVYIMLTILRSARDDFGVEIWRDMGVTEKPEVFALTESAVAFIVVGLNALAFLITRNMTAIRVTMGMMSAAFVVVIASAVAQKLGMLTPFGFMLACGVGLYIPYVAFHTTIFERLVAASRHPGNLGFLMYFADAMGYLGYSVVLVVRSLTPPEATVLPLFTISLWVLSSVSILAMILSLFYFERVLQREGFQDAEGEPPVSLEELAPAD